MPAAPISKLVEDEDGMVFCRFEKEFLSNFPKWGEAAAGLTCSDGVKAVADDDHDAIIKSAARNL
jgi:hypothetical protein